MITSIALHSMRAGILFYQKVLNPLLKILNGGQSSCRFHPTCSNYYLQAIEHHGPWKGSWLGIKRIFRCHPWGGSGEDPIPK